jgi:hypothetical protein
MSILQCAFIKLQKFLPSLRMFLGMLAAVAIATVAMKKLDPQEDDTTKTVEEILLAVAQGKPEFAVSRACEASNLSSWSETQTTSQIKIKDFRVVESKPTTKLNGQWVIPVVCEITGNDGSKRQITMFLDSYRRREQCVVYVRD